MRQVVLIAIGLMLVAADAFYADNAHVEPESLELPLTMALGGVRAAVQRARPDGRRHTRPLA